jgi:hypothetical protein
MKRETAPSPRHVAQALKLSERCFGNWKVKEGQRIMMEFLEEYEDAFAFWVWFAIILFWLYGFSLF